MKLIRKFFGEFDMFAAPPTLRAKQQKQTSSLFSGVISFLLALFFCYVFISSSINIFNYKDIQSVQTESKLSGSEAKAEDIFFAFRVGYLEASVSERYFDIGYYIITEDGQNISKKLQRCKLQQWSRLGENATQLFQQYQLNQFYCPDDQSNLDLKKVYYANQPQYIIIYARPCTSHQFCENQTSQRQFVRQLSGAQGAIFSLVYFLQQVIKPQDRNPVQYSLNTDIQLAFTTRRGIIATIELASFKIVTDIGVMPVKEQQVVQGNFIHAFRQTSVELESPQDNYAFIYVYMNRRFIYIERAVGKIDEMLSYAGGLFSLIVTGISLFLKSFNQYRYELMVAEGIFHQDQNGNKIRQHDFTYLKYIKYVVFDWINLLCCNCLTWKDSLIVDNARNQANCHLDVTRLFRKIQFLESSLLQIVSREERDCYSIIKPDQLGRIKRNRILLQYYDAIIQGKQALTLQEHAFEKKFYKFGLFLAGIQQSPSNEVFKIANEDVSAQNMNQFMGEYEDIQDKDQALQIGIKKFKQIAAQADKIKLQDVELRIIQKQIAQQFFQLKPEVRHRIQQRIPIIILHRLMKYKNKQSDLFIPCEKEQMKTRYDQKPKKTRKKLPPLHIQFDNYEQNQNKQEKKYNCS